MNKSDLQELARFGVRYKLAEVERFLAQMFRQFPDEFLTAAPPLFLRPDEKGNGNSWPAFTLTLPATNGDTNGDTSTRKPWTPEARAAASQRMRGRLKGNSAEWGSVLYHRVHDDLLAQPDHSSRLTELVKRLGAKHSSTRTSIMTHPKIFRYGNGVVRLIKPVTNTAKAGGHGGSKPGLVKRMPPHKWGDKVWEQLHDYLLTQPDHTAPLRTLMKGVKTEVHATVISAVKMHSDVLERSGPGTYRLLRIVSAEEKRAITSGLPQPPAST
jgi:hypothetical protein